MDKSVRLETYVSVDTATEIEHVTENKSEFIRNAIHEKMEREQ